jgi:hypothetical protein
MTRALILQHNVFAQTSAQAFRAAGSPIVISLGGLVGQMLTPYKALTTLPVTRLYAKRMGMVGHSLDNRRSRRRDRDRPLICGPSFPYRRDGHDLMILDEE